MPKLIHPDLLRGRCGKRHMCMHCDMSCVQAPVRQNFGVSNTYMHSKLKMCWNRCMWSNIGRCASHMPSFKFLTSHTCMGPAKMCSSMCVLLITRWSCEKNVKCFWSCHMFCFDSVRCERNTAKPLRSDVWYNRNMVQEVR